MADESILQSYETGHFFLEHIRVKPFSMSRHHFHNHYEIYLLISGERRYFIRDGIYTLKEGDIVLIGRNELHMTKESSPETYERVLLYFDEEYLDGFIGNIRDTAPLEVFLKGVYVIRAGTYGAGRLIRLIRKMLEECRRREAGFETVLKLTLSEMLIQIDRIIRRDPDHGLLPAAEEGNKMFDIARFINANFSENIDLKLLSGNFYLSPSYISRKFKEVTGLNLSDYINTRRVMEAQKLLKMPGINITDIAGRTGYESLTHFERVFRKIAGVNPAGYRKMYMGRSLPL